MATVTGHEAKTGRDYLPWRCPVVMGVIAFALGVSSVRGFPATYWDWAELDPLTISRVTVTEKEGTTLLQWDGLELIKAGQIWRAVTPTFIHLGPAHLLLNVCIIYLFAAPVEAIRGSWRVLFSVLVVAVVSNVTQFYCSSQQPFFGGMSMIWCGTLGYRSIWSWTTPGSRLSLRRWMMWVGFSAVGVGIVIALEPIASQRPDWFPRISNATHVAGVVVGLLFGSVDVLLARKQKASETER